MVKQAVILAGGAGTRLKEVLDDLPKPMLKIGGKPLLEHQIILARKHGISKFLLLTGYNPDPIIDYFGNGTKWSVSISYSQEKCSLGTAGAVINAYHLLQECFFVFYGDTIFNVDLKRLWNGHHQMGASVTLLAHPNDHPHDSDLIETNALGWVKTIHPYPHPKGTWLPNLVNAALYIIRRDILNPWVNIEVKVDFSKDIFPLLLKMGVKIFSYNSPEYIKDVGTPRRYKQVIEDYMGGKISRGSIDHSKPAIFLDRDGTLVEEVNRISSPDQLVIIEGVDEAIREINRSIYYAVLITNQAVIARGDCTEDDLKLIHNKLETLLGESGAYLDRIYYCPHHPDQGFPGERKDLKINCTCRKPDTGMIDRAVRSLNIDLSNSWLIGDSSIDMETARRAGIKSVLVRTGYGGEDGKYDSEADYEFYSLNEAIKFILESYPEILKTCRNWINTVKPGQIISVGGPARSGKSLIANVLKQSFHEIGLVARILHLDSWLTDKSARHAHWTVRERFDYSSITQFFNSLLQHPGQKMQIPVYCRSTGESKPHGREFFYDVGDILIFEGVPALDIEELVNTSALKIYVLCDEEVRKKYFMREYRLRGYTDQQTIDLYLRRLAEENTIVIKGKAVADIIWENGQ